MPTVNILVSWIFQDFDLFVWPAVARLCLACFVLKKKKKKWKFQLDVLEYVGAENQTKENS